jgi:hypothetical protein
MARRKKWENLEEMWQEAARRVAGGASYRDIAGWLAKPEVMNHYGLVESPSEDTVRREVKIRLLSTERPIPVRQASSFWEDIHIKELVYFGQGFRDLIHVPPRQELSSAMITSESMSALWKVWPATGMDVRGLAKSDVWSRDPEQDTVAAEWVSLRYDARNHSLYPAFRQHMGSHSPCWESLEHLEVAFNDYMGTARRAYLAILSEAGRYLPQLLAEDGQKLAGALLGGVNLSNRPREVFHGDPIVVGPPVWRLVLAGETFTSEDGPAELQMIHESVQRILRSRIYNDDINRLEGAGTVVRQATREFRQTLTPDARLRKLLLDGHCTWCPTRAIASK